MKLKLITLLLAIAPPTLASVESIRQGSPKTRSDTHGSSSLPPGGATSIVETSLNATTSNNSNQISSINSSVSEIGIALASATSDITKNAHDIDQLNELINSGSVGGTEGSWTSQTIHIPAASNHGNTWHTIATANIPNSTHFISIENAEISCYRTTDGFSDNIQVGTQFSAHTNENHNREGLIIGTCIPDRLYSFTYRFVYSKNRLDLQQKSFYPYSTSTIKTRVTLPVSTYVVK